MEPSLGEALAAFRHANRIPVDEAQRPTWTCRLGPITLRLPNFAWRRDGVLAHDLHHVLTGVPCTLRGECQMAAWELAAGPLRRCGALLFCLPLVPLGLLSSPRRTLRAYRAGKGATSLHGHPIETALLRLPLDQARAALAIRPIGDMHQQDWRAARPIPYKSGNDSAREGWHGGKGRIRCRHIRHQRP